jgi:hypothetical protein
MLLLVLLLLSARPKLPLTHKVVLWCGTLLLLLFSWLAG